MEMEQKLRNIYTIQSERFRVLKYVLEVRHVYILEQNTYYIMCQSFECDTLMRVLII